MARINIELKWQTDPRRKPLAKRLGSERLADGMLVEIAGILLSHKGKGIPLAEFKFIENFNDWLECGLGCIDGEWVRICGSTQYQEYFEKQQENGSKGGRPPKPKLTQDNPVEPKETQSNRPPLKNNPKNPSPSLSLSVSPSPSKKINNSSFKAGAGAEEIAARCLLAVQRFGPDEGDALREFVGDQLYERVRTSCGWQKVREMKRDNFAIINLTRNIGSVS